MKNPPEMSEEAQKPDTNDRSDRDTQRPGGWDWTSFISVEQEWSSTLGRIGIDVHHSEFSGIGRRQLLRGGFEFVWARIFNSIALPPRRREHWNRSFQQSDRCES